MLILAKKQKDLCCANKRLENRFQNAEVREGFANVFKSVILTWSQRGGNCGVI